MKSDIKVMKSDIKVVRRRKGKEGEMLEKV